MRSDVHISTRLAGRSLARLIRFVARTSTVVDDPPDLLVRLAATHPCIIACWHGQFMMLPTLRPEGVQVAAMVARHGDAEFIGQAMAALDVELIRGAGAGTRKRDRGGAQALRAAVAALESGRSLVMTADVPPGPARKAGLGIITIARYSGRPIVPAAVVTSRSKTFATWSRMTVNLPFSRLARVAGKAIHVPPDADAATMERLRAELEQALDDVTRHAYALAGADVARIAVDDPAASDMPPSPVGWRLAAYARAMSAARPAAPILLRRRERQGKEDPRRRPERLGIASMSRPDGPLIWFHAASVGETNAVLPVINALLAKRGDAHVLLTSGTITSAALAARRLPARAFHQYVPVDVPQYIRSFLGHWRPDLAVFTESEIWPNLILESHASGVPLALVNARLSSRSFKRWKRSMDLSRPLFSRFGLVLAQNERLARRFTELGARQVRPVGNLKIDAPPPPVDPVQFAALAAAIAGRPLVVAASTHDGEEMVIAETHRILAREFDRLVTIIAPRHPERGTGLAEALKARGLTVTQRSLGALPDPRTEIYIADTIGELGTFYALTPVAFVGGSLVDRGGQNPIEAVRHGAAVITGPSIRNFADEYAALFKRGGAIEVHDAVEIAAAIRRLAHDPAGLEQMRSGAQAALATLAGALDATTESLAEMLPAATGGEGLLRAS